MADELQRVYRKMRREASALHGTLRDLKERNNARISLFEEEDRASSGDYVGPSGFGGGASRRGAREVFFGALQGTTVLIRDYKPVTELNDVHRNLSVFGQMSNQGEAIEFIAELSAKERQAAVAALQLADKNFAKFEKRAKDAIQFFSAENIANLSRFGAHELNRFPFSIEIKSAGARRNLSIRTQQGQCFVAIDARIFELQMAWTAIDYEPFRKDE